MDVTIHQESTLEFLKRKKCKDYMKHLFWQFLQLHLATKPCYFFPANNQRRYECSTTLSDCVLIPIFHLLLFQTLCFWLPVTSRPLPALSADPSCSSAIVSHSASQLPTDAEQAHARESIKIPATLDFFAREIKMQTPQGM